MLRRLLAICALLPAVLAPAASAKVLHAQRGDVAARLSFTVKHVNRVHDAQLQVSRGGATAFDAPLTIAGCEAEFCLPVQVRLTDLDRDGEPEVLADAFSEGAHCCTFTDILRWDGSAYQQTFHDWGNPGYRLRRLGGRPAFITADDRFPYEFAAYAFSGSPVQILRFRAGALRDVTTRFPGRIRSDARRWKHAYRHAQAGEGRGVLAAWVADEWQLGRRDQAHRFLEAQRQLGHLHRHYIRVLERQLTKWGY